MKRKFTLLLMALLALAGFKSWGQETITVQIGEGANYAYNLPFNSYYGYSYNEMLFKASEINDAAQSTISSGTINSISFQAYWGNSGTTSFSYDIYMKNVDRTDYNDGGWATVSESDKVKSGTITSGVNDWVELALDSPFQWDGTKNLLIVFDADNYGVYVKTNFYYDYPGFNCCHTVYSDSYNYEPSSSYPTDGNMSVTSYRPNIKLNMDVVTATTYAINLTQPDAAVGTISSNPATEAAEGATVTLSANLNHGYEFDSWTVTNATTTESITVTNNQFTMPGSAVNVMANITELSPRSVNITNPTDDATTTATLSATPSTGVFEGDEVRLSYSDLAEGYKFLNYVATNASTSEPIAIQQGWDSGSYSYFIMPNADVNLTASVKQIRTINVAEMQHGSISLNPNPQHQQIAAGETITITPNPDYGYAMETLTITEATSGNTITPEEQTGYYTTYTFEMPEDDVNIAATFASTGTLYTVTLPEETEMGSVNANRIQNLENDEVMLTVYAKTGYYLESIVVRKDSDLSVVEFTNQSTSYSYTYCYFNMPGEDVTVTVTFGSYPRYTLTLPQASAAGYISSNQSDLTNILADTYVYLYAYPSDGFVVANLTVKKDSDQSEVSILGSWYTDDEDGGYYTYYFQMPEGNATVNAEFKGSLTVCNGSATNRYVPFDSYYCDDRNTKSQFIIPATLLEAMDGGIITGIKFYTNFNKEFSSYAGTDKWDVYFKEVENTTVSGYDESGLTKVYSGALVAANNELAIEFNENNYYTYRGGNLLVYFLQTEYYTNTFTNQNAIFYGMATSETTAIYYGQNSGTVSFLPKTTFSFTPTVKYNIAIDEEMENGTVLASAESAAEGETITLTPQPEAGYGLTAWNVTTATGSVTVNDNNQFTMPASDVTVSATFGLLDRYTVTVNQPTEGATLSVDPTTDWYEGLEVKLNCELTTGYQFGGWIVTSESTTLDVLHNYSENYDYFMMPAADVNVTATINKVYAISIAPTENGEIYTYPANNAAVGTYVQVDAYPAEGYYLESLLITDQSGEVEHDANNSFIMPASDVTVTATFSNAHYSITLNEPENGTLTASVEDLTDVLPTSYVTLTATPASHYHLSSLTIMANEEEVPVVSQWENNYMIQMPAGDVEVTATFEEDAKYAVSLDYNEEGGSITLQGGNTEYYAGDDVYVYFTPETGYILYSLEAEDSEHNPVTITNNQFVMPESAVTVTAVFVHGIIVNDGNNTNEYVPFYGYYADELTKSQFIIPASQIRDLQGGDINSMVFYLNHLGENSDNITDHHFNGTWDVYITEVDVNQTTLSGYETSEMTKVYSGNMDIVGLKMTVNFNESSYSYRNGNLLIYFQQTSKCVNSNYKRTKWYGVNKSSNTAYAGYTDQYGGGSHSARQFLPKVTFLYEPGEPLPEYNITFHSNGVVSEPQTLTEGQSLPNPTNIPAGLTFAGWATEDIETYYNEEQAEQIEYVTAARAEEDLYAVFSYSENETTSKGAGTWIKVTDVNELANDDKVVFVYNNSKIMCDRTNEWYANYSASDVAVSNNVIYSIPDNAIEFTLQSNGDNWKLKFVDVFESGETTLAYQNYDLLPQNFYNYPGTYPDTWTAESYSGGVIFEETGYSGNRYIAYNSGYPNYQIRGNAADIACQVYKASAPVVTKTYYMTEVLTNGSITANTTAKNIVITTGTVTVDNNIVLTMNGNGLFRNKNAANFVFGYGAQLITNNAGVLATMKKHINGTDWYTISSPLAASVNVTDVTNLIPGNDVGNTNYDLYRLNEAAFRWENARPETNQEPAFTTIDKGVGYIYSNNAGADYIAFAGEINVEDVECTLTKDAGYGFNLIGNPFSQNITLADVAGAAELAEGYYVLSNENTWGAMIETGNIAPLQGFLVQATTAGNVTISKPTSESKGERSNEHNTNIEMIVSNSNHRDNAYAMFGEGTGLNKINHRNAEAPMLYIPQGGEDFAIAFMDENTTLFPVSFKAMTTGKYSISLKATEDVNTLVLIDNQTGAETNMLLEESYSFIGSPADRENRFTVKLGISQNNGQNDNEHFVYQYGNELIINGEGTLQIFDVLGRVVISEEVHGQRVNIGNLVKGTYIVRMTGENVMTQKIIVK